MKDDEATAISGRAEESGAQCQPIKKLKEAASMKPVEDERGEKRKCGLAQSAHHGGTTRTRLFRDFITECGPTENCPACRMPNGRYHRQECKAKRAEWERKRKAAYEEPGRCSRPKAIVADDAGGTRWCHPSTGRCYPGA